MDNQIDNQRHSTPGTPSQDHIETNSITDPRRSQTEPIPHQTEVCSSCWLTCFSTQGYRTFCQAIGFQSFEYEAYLSQISFSVKAGCPWCSGINAIFAEEDMDLKNPYIKKHREVIKVRMQPEYFEQQEGVFNVEFQSYGDYPRRYNASLVASFARPGKAIPGLPMSGEKVDLRSEETFGKIREWLGECARAHEDCGQSSSLGSPSRLIDLTNQARPRIIKTEPNTHYEYAALSYCWGIDQHGTLSSTNLDDRLQYLDLSDTSQAVRDAVLVTSRLGLCHLWIDAMCIL